MLKYDGIEFFFPYKKLWLRYAWYLVMVSMQDETGQKKGISDVAYCPGNMLTSVSIPLNKVNYFFSRVGDVFLGLKLSLTPSDDIQIILQSQSLHTT